MTTKHPIARLFKFVSSMERLYSDEVNQRLDLYLDYVSELESEERVEMYNDISTRISECFIENKTITRMDVMNSIPDQWPCSEWFDINKIDIKNYMNLDAEVAVFDYYEILTSFESADYKRLIMLLILDAVKLAGNDKCNREIANIKSQIEDDDLLTDHGYGGSAELFDAAKDIIGEFSPTAQLVLTNLLDVYQSGDGSMGEVLEKATDVLLQPDTISTISNEVSFHSNEIANNTDKITENINRMAKAAGVDQSVTDIVTEMSRDVISDPSSAFNVMTSHASAVIGIDEDDIRGVVNNVLDAVPTDEIAEVTKTVTDSFISDEPSTSTEPLIDT